MLTIFKVHPFRDSYDFLQSHCTLRQEQVFSSRRNPVEGSTQDIPMLGRTAMHHPALYMEIWKFLVTPIIPQEYNKPIIYAWAGLIPLVTAYNYIHGKGVRASFLVEMALRCRVGHKYGFKNKALLYGVFVIGALSSHVQNEERFWIRKALFCLAYTALTSVHLLDVHFRSDSLWRLELVLAEF